MAINVLWTRNKLAWRFQTIFKRAQLIQLPEVHKVHSWLLTTRLYSDSSLSYSPDAHSAVYLDHVIQMHLDGITFRQALKLSNKTVMMETGDGVRQGSSTSHSFLSLLDGPFISARPSFLSLLDIPFFLYWTVLFISTKHFFLSPLNSPCYLH